MKMTKAEKIDWLTSSSAEIIYEDRSYSWHKKFTIISDENQIDKLALMATELIKEFDTWFSSEKKTNKYSDDNSILEYQRNLPESLLNRANEYSVIFNKYTKYTNEEDGGKS